nr:LPO_1073/Vpar_1526 family protein [Streptomyces sp. CBMAI 2042]
MDVFKDNFAKLSTKAHEVAFQRADEFTSNYLSELHQRRPESIENLQDPGVQADLLEAQSGFAKSGDQDLGEILVDILVDRTAELERNLVSLTLGAALSTAQKLTSSQFSALSAMMVFQQMRVMGISHPKQVYMNISSCLAPMQNQIMSLSQSDVRYLAALGCLTISMGSTSIHQALQRMYPGLFSIGIEMPIESPGLSGSAENGPESVVYAFKDTPAITRDIRDPTKFRVAATDTESLHSLLERSGLTEHRELFERTMKARPLSGDVIVEEIEAFDRRIGDVMNSYNTNQLTNCSNTAVGIAIGHANIRRVTGGTFDAPLSVWLD